MNMTLWEGGWDWVTGASNLGPWGNISSRNHEGKTRSMLREDKSGRSMIEAANLARTLQLKDVLVAALYECCRLPTDVLLHGMQLEDGSSLKLDAQDALACIDARGRLAQTTLALFNQALFDPAPTLQIFGTLAPCSEFCNMVHVEEAWQEALLSQSRLSDYLYTPLSAREGIVKFAEDSQLCDNCKNKYISQYDRARTQIREKLDVIMGVADL